MDASQLTKALGGIEMTRVSPPCVVSVLPVWLWRGVPSTHYRPGGLTFFENWRATIPRTGGQPSRELANTHVRPCLGGGRFVFLVLPFLFARPLPRIGGRPSRELAGSHPENWRATIPRTGGQPSRELMGNQPEGLASKMCAKTRVAWTPRNSPRLWAESRWRG